MFLSSRAASHLAPVPSIVMLERGRREGGERERKREREDGRWREERGRTGREDGGKGEGGERDEVC